MKYLISLKNGGIINILTDEWFCNGCPTCDYGSQYVNEIDIFLSCFEIHIEINKMYEYALSSDTLLKIFLPNIEALSNIDENEFANWFKNKLIEFTHLHNEDIDIDIKEKNYDSI